jgi:hypothetical protein
MAERPVQQPLQRPDAALDFAVKPGSTDPRMRSLFS